MSPNLIDADRHRAGALMAESHILATRSYRWWTWVGWNPGSTNSRDLTERASCGATLKSAQRRQPSSGVGMERPRRHLRLALNDGQVGPYRRGRHGP